MAVAVDWERERRERGRRIAGIEKMLFASFMPVIEDALSVMRPRILVAGDRVDPRGAFAADRKSVV